jgi:hypothetical protein
MTEFRRALRLYQARWRAAHGHPIGTQPIRPRPVDTAVRLVGSRLPLDYALETGANFVTPAALDAVKTRLRAKEPHQSLSEQRLWADLLSSTAMCFNLFGDLAADLTLADRAVHTWWPDAPGTVCAVRFEHSPGRLDPSYIANLSAFTVAFVLARDDGTRGIVAIEADYHEFIRRYVPKPARLPRYLEVTEKSGVFGPGALDAVNGTDLLLIWLRHLLMLSMLQHPSHEWSWGRLVVIHPSGNTDIADGCARYRGLLSDDATFSSLTLDDLFGSGALPAPTLATLRDRYGSG